MIDREEFEQKRDGFAIWLKKHKSKFADLESLREEFVRRFAPEKLATLPLDQYVVGRQKKTTFCYWLETRLRELGSIKGGTTAGSKFGIYFGKTKQDSRTMYRFPPKYGASIDEAYDTIRRSMVDLLAAGETKDFQAIQNNLLAPMFKGKILSTFYPDKYLNVFSERFLKYYLIRLGFPVSESEDESPILLGQRLLDFKNKDEVMSQWSNIEYGFFLWNKYGDPENPNEAGSDPDTDPTINLPPLPQVRSVEIKDDLVDFNKDTSREKGEKVVRPDTRKRDYVKEAKKNTITGNRGEEIVLKLERDMLRMAGKHELAKKVTRISEQSDAYGYDIHSYTPDGLDKYIEVKATRSPYSPNPSFIISANELAQGRELKERYYICWVFSAASKQPQYKYIQSPFGNPDKFSLEPRSYVVGYKFE
jgi:Domain of unknown function (DUF3883)